MVYALRRSESFRRDVDDWLRYLRGLDIAVSDKYYYLLEEALTDSIAGRPQRYAYFHETGAPYRARLFRMSRSTYWIIYRIDEQGRSIDLLRFWNTARKPLSHGL
jgi:ParE toxin of type II toxin-antitoxin system, parDE